MKRDVTSRNMRQIDPTAFSDNVDALQFDIEDLVSSYNLGLRAVLDKHTPLRTRRVTDRPSAPWLTLGVKEAKKERLTLRTQVAQDWPHHS